MSKFPTLFPWNRVCFTYGSSQVALVVKNPPAKARDKRATGSIPGWGRYTGGGGESDTAERPQHRYVSSALSACAPLCPHHAQSPFSVSAPLFLPCKEVHQDHFSRFYMCVLIDDVSDDVSLTSLRMADSRFIHLTTTDSQHF